MAKKLWGGRFGKKTNPLVEKFTKSIQYDYKLAKYDVLGSLAHVQVLKKAGLLKSTEASKLTKALNSLYVSIINNTFKPDHQCEDIHTQIQNLLYDKAGGVALKIHTARSRNDQVALATKMYCKEQLKGLEALLAELIKALSSLASKNKELIIPGFTHLQHAQPVYVKDYLCAYVEMLKRDTDRLQFISKSIKTAMGAGAMAGTPIDYPKYNVKIKGIAIAPTANSLDTVSDRDFVIDSLSALSVIGMHLSRFSEDMIIWSTREFNFVDIDDSFCTGSSLMPQKKNPDVLELIRGYAGRLNGNLISALTMIKGLPLAYNRDMQLDKEPLFNSFEIVSSELKVLAGLIKTVKFNKEIIKKHLKDESLYATDLVYYLVYKKIPFKEAHTIIGKLVKYSVDNRIDIKEMSQSQLNEFSNKLIKREIIKLFDPKVSVESKKSIKR